MLAGALHDGHDAAALLAAVGIDPPVWPTMAPRAAGRLRRALQPPQRSARRRGLRLLVADAQRLLRVPLPRDDHRAAARRSTGRAIRFLRAVLPDMRITLERDGPTPSSAIAEQRPLLVDRVFAYEWLLRLLHGLACWLVGRGIALDAVDFPYPRPAHADDYALIYTAHSRFEAPRLAARIAGNLLELPVRRDEAALQRFLDGAPGKLTMLYRNDRELVMRVRDHLRAAAAGTAGTGSDRRGTEADAAHAQLAARGRGLQLPRDHDALRRDIALSRIAKSAQPVATLAADLGYADPRLSTAPSSAGRAFAPAYRRRLQESDDGRRTARRPSPDRVCPQLIKLLSEAPGPRGRDALQLFQRMSRPAARSCHSCASRPLPQPSAPQDRAPRPRP